MPPPRRMPRRGGPTNHRKGLAMDKLEDMGWTPEEAAMMRRIDPAVRDRVLNLLAQTQLGVSEFRQTVCADCGQDIEGDVDSNGSEPFLDRGRNAHGSDGHEHYPEEWTQRYMEEDDNA